MSACFSCLLPFPGTGAEACGTCLLATPLPLGRALQSSHGESDDTVPFPWCSYAGWLYTSFEIYSISLKTQPCHLSKIFLGLLWQSSG